MISLRFHKRASILFPLYLLCSTIVPASLELNESSGAKGPTPCNYCRTAVSATTGLYCPAEHPAVLPRRSR